MCLDGFVKVPELMEAPDKVDYPTDGDSDDNAGFSIKVFELVINCLGSRNG